MSRLHAAVRAAGHSGSVSTAAHSAHERAYPSGTEISPARKDELAKRLQVTP
jgi:hypothetical protein